MLDSDPAGSYIEYRQKSQEGYTIPTHGEERELQELGTAAHSFPEPSSKMVLEGAWGTPAQPSCAAVSRVSHPGIHAVLSQTDPMSASLHHFYPPAASLIPAG